MLTGGFFVTVLLSPGFGVTLGFSLGLAVGLSPALGVGFTGFGFIVGLTLITGFLVGFGFGVGLTIFILGVVLTLTGGLGVVFFTGRMGLAGLGLAVGLSPGFGVGLRDGGGFRGRTTLGFSGFAVGLVVGLVVGFEVGFEVGFVVGFVVGFWTSFGLGVGFVGLLGLDVFFVVEVVGERKIKSPPAVGVLDPRGTLL